MKRLLNKLIVLVLMLSLIVQLFPSNASAAGSTSSELFFAATGGNVYYTVSAQTNTASIVGCDNSVTAVTIPATLPDGDGNPVPVTSIGTSAFYQEGYEGFSLVNQCQLAEISFGEDSQLMFIGEHTFKMTAIESVVLPASLTSIGYMGFARCANLTSVTMAELEEGESYSLTTIGNYAFGECPLLAEITLSAPLLSIGYSAFLQCRSLSSITLPSTLVSIGSGAFNDCSALASVTMAELPEGVTEHALSFIEAYAFGYCPNLVTISLPASLTTLGNEVFKNCTSLASVTFEESETPNLTSIGNGAFSGCAALTSITLPSSVTSVGNSAFYQSGLTSVTLSASVTSIGTGAFEKCLSLTEATILGQTSIVENTFSGCTALATVTIPNVTSIGITAFKGTGLTGVTLPDTLTSIGMNAFQNCTSLSSITWPDNESFTEVTGFNGCTSLPNSIISGLPSSVTTLGDYAFTGCSFTALVFPASITTIGEYAFYACNGLSGRTVDLPATITRVKARAFGYITTSAVSRLTLRFHNPQVSLRTDSGEFADILAHDYSDYQHTRYVDFFGAAEKSPGVASDVVSYVEAYFNAAYRVYTFTALDDLPVSYTVSGTLPAGASVSITRGSATVPATPGETPNSFTASVLTGADVTVTVSQAGYYDQVRTKAAADFTANWNLGAITLDPIPTTGRMYLNLTRSDTGAPFSSFNGLTFTLSKGAVILQEGTHYTISFPFLVISAEADVQSTDLLTLTVAADDSLKMSGGTATGTKLGGEFSLTLPAWGTLSVTTDGSFAGENNVLVFDSDGRLTQAGVTEAGSYSSEALKAGTYTVVAFNASAGFSSVTSLTALNLMGLVNGTDYTSQSVSVTDQITTTGTLTVPLLDLTPAGSIVNADGCAVTLDKATIVCGTPFNVRVFYALNEAPDSAEVKITLPPGASVASVCSETAILPGAAIVDQTLTVSTTRQSGVFYLYGVSLPLTDAGAQSIGASVTVGLVTVPLGSASFNAQPLVMKPSEVWLAQRENSVTLYTEPGTAVSFFVGNAAESVRDESGNLYVTNSLGRVTIPYTLPDDAYSGQSFDLRAEAGAHQVSERVVYSAAETEIWDFSFVHAKKSTPVITAGQPSGNGYYVYVATGAEANKYWSFYARFVSLNDMTNNNVTVQIRMMDNSMRIEPMTLIRTSEWIDGKAAYEYAAEVYIEQAGDHVFHPSLLPCGFGLDYEYDALSFDIEPSQVYGRAYAQYDELLEELQNQGAVLPTEDLSGLFFDDGYQVSDEDWFLDLEPEGQSLFLETEEAVRMVLEDLTTIFRLPQNIGDYANWDEVLQEVGKAGAVGEDAPGVTYSVGTPFPAEYVGSVSDITMDFSSGSAMLDTDTEALPAEPQTGFTISENNWTLTANYMDDALENAAISALGQSVNFMENKVGTLATWVNNLPEGHLVQDAVDSATTNLGRLKEGLKFTGIAVGIFSTNKNAGDYVTASIREAELEGYIENLEIYKNYYEQKNRPSCWLSTDRELIVARKLLGFLVGQRKHSCTDMCMGAGFTVAAGVTGYLTGGAGAGATAGANLVYDVGSNAINLRRAAIIEELQAELDKLRQARISECGTFNSNNRSDRRMRDITPLLDPSGIVYEALEASPLEGVTATIWYAADQIGTGAALWDAGSYSQINPQLTGADGAYAWDVSQGWWQVRFTKAGYLDASTPWLQVPPPQMNLTTPMVSTAAPTVTAVHAYPDYIEMVFSQFMDKSAPLTLSGGLTGVWQGDALYAKVLRIPLSGFSLGDTVSFTLTGARNYAGVAMADYTNSLPVSPRPAEILLNYDTVVAMKAGEMPNVTVRVKDTEGNYMQGVTVEAFVANTLLAAMDADAVTDENGTAVFSASALLPGLTDLTFSVQGTSLTKTVSLRVTVDANRPARPTAQVGAISLTAGSPTENYVTVQPGTTLTLSAEAGVTIYYTTDDTCPCQNSESRQEYTDPIALTANRKYRITGYKDGMAYSERLNITVTVSENGETPESPSDPEAPAPWENPFGDVSETDWFYDAVRYAVENGLMVGTGDEAFSPQTGTSRGMVVTILWRLEGEPETVEPMTFPDVQEGRWYSKAVAWATKNGIAQGFTTGLFGPEEDVTREQMVKLLFAYAVYKSYDVRARDSLSAFIDSPSDWALESVQWAVAEGLLQGMGGGLLGPRDGARRSECAVILQRFIEGQRGSTGE